MAEATNTTLGTVVLAGDLTGSAQTPTLKPTGVLPGTYKAANIVVNNKGLVIDAIEGDPDLLSCATTSSCGFVVVGDNISVTGGEISIPIATSEVLGVVKMGSGLVSDLCGTLNIDIGNVDLLVAEASASAPGKVQIGDGISVISGVISSDITYITENIPDATTLIKGKVQIGSNIGVTSGEVYIPLSDTSTKGVLSIQSNSGLEITGGVLSGVISTSLVKGVVQVGTNINVATGTISIEDSSTLVKGVVEIGGGLSVVGGVVSVNLPDATTSTKGVVQVPEDLESGLWAPSGMLQFQFANNSQKGIISINSTNYGLSVSSGVVSGKAAVDGSNANSRGVVSIVTTKGLSVDVDGALTTNSATVSDFGVVQVGDNISVSTGTISVASAQNTIFGVAKSGNTSTIVCTSGELDIGTNIPTKSTSNVFFKSQAEGSGNLGEFRKGYYAGDGVDPYNLIHTVGFNTDTMAYSSATLSTTRWQVSGGNSDTKGYFFGGVGKPSNTCTGDIDGVDFATDSSINPSASLSTHRAYTTSLSSNTSSIICGGHNCGGPPTVYNLLSKFTHSTESNSTISSVLTSTQKTAIGSSDRSITHGYIFVGGPYGRSVNKFIYSSETITDLGDNYLPLSNNDEESGSVSSSSNAYMALEFSSKISYTTDVVSSTGLGSGSGTNSTTHGYFASGGKLNFSLETMSTFTSSLDTQTKSYGVFSNKDYTGSASRTFDSTTYQTVNFTLDSDITLLPPIDSVDGQRLLVIFKQDSVGGHTVSFDSFYKSQSSIVINSGANDTTIIEVIVTDDVGLTRIIY